MTDVENHSRSELLDQVLDENLPRYAGLEEKAAALLHSLARNHTPDDGK
ncbi:hypothetical protein [Arthrobacter castelli]|nr:hypothetical protein [Arthrobacter castelli]